MQLVWQRQHHCGYGLVCEHVVKETDRNASIARKHGKLVRIAANAAGEFDLSGMAGRIRQHAAPGPDADQGGLERGLRHHPSPARDVVFSPGGFAARSLDASLENGVRRDQVSDCRNSRCAVSMISERRFCSVAFATYAPMNDPKR